MNAKWKKNSKLSTIRPTPQLDVVICTGDQIAAVLGKARRMNRKPGEPQKIGVNKWSITLGSPMDDFHRRPIDDTEHIYTFTPGRVL